MLLSYNDIFTSVRHNVRLARRQSDYRAYRDISFAERYGGTPAAVNPTREGWSEAFNLLTQAFSQRETRINFQRIRAVGERLTNPCAEIPLAPEELTNLEPPGSFVLGGNPYPDFIYSEQHKFVAAALFLWMEGVTNSHPTYDREIVYKLCQKAPNKKQRISWGNKAQTFAARNLVGFFYGSGNHPIEWWPQYRNMVSYMLRAEANRDVIIDSYSTYLSGLLYDAIGFGKKKMPHAWRTEPVIGILKGMKADVALDRGPILADALQDAGCNNEDLLHHLRTGPISLGSWLFRSTGIM